MVQKKEKKNPLANNDGEKVITAKVDSPEAAAQKETEQLILKNIKMVKELRVRLYGLIHITITTGSPSFEKSMASSSLKMVKDWLGELLESLGENVSNKKVLSVATDISEEQDISEPIKVQVHKENGKDSTVVDANEIQSINHVRTDVVNVIAQIGILNTLTDTLYENYIFQHLTEAKFWSERELYRIKNEYKRKLFAAHEKGARKLPQKSKHKKPLLGNRVDSGKAKEGKTPVISITGNKSEK